MRQCKIGISSWQLSLKNYRSMPIDKDKYSKMYIDFPCDFYAKEMLAHGLRKMWLAKRQNLTRFFVQKYCQNGILLDIGCGNCLWNTQAKPVIGIDICESMLRYNHQKNLLFTPLAADISEGLPIRSETAGTVIITEVLEHFYSYSFIVEEIWRVLKKDGVVIVSVPYAKLPGIWGIIFPIWCKFKGLKEKNEYYLWNCGHLVNFGPKMLCDTFHRFTLLEKKQLDLMTMILVGKKN